MPQVRPNCEWCGCALPVDAPGEVIYIFGCTFCDACVRAAGAAAKPRLGASSPVKQKLQT